LEGPSAEKLGLDANFLFLGKESEYTPGKSVVCADCLIYSQKSGAEAACGERSATGREISRPLKDFCFRALYSWAFPAGAAQRTQVL
jgi:hypothetical protein